MDETGSPGRALRGRLLALGVPEAEQTAEKLRRLLPPETRAAAAGLAHETIAELAADLLAEGFAVPAGRERFKPEAPLGRGAHACLFYRATEELVALAARAFGAAIDRNELCVWALPSWLTEKEAAQDLREAAPSLAQPLADGRIELLQAGACYLDGAGRLREREELLGSWLAKERAALERGFSAMLAIGDTSELPRLLDVDGYLAYEHAIAPAIRGTTIAGLCTYSLAHCPHGVIGRLLYPHARSVLSVGRAWQAITDPDLGREQVRAVQRSFLD